MTERFNRQIFRLETAHALLPKLTVGRTRIYGGIIRVEIFHPDAVPGDDEAWVSAGTGLAGYLEEIGHKILGTCTAQYGSKGNGLVILTDPMVKHHLNRLRKGVRNAVKASAPAREASRKESAKLEVLKLMQRCQSKYKLPPDTVREVFEETIRLSVVEEVLKS